MRKHTALALTALIALFSMDASADDLMRRSAAVFRKSTAVLDDLEEREHAKAAAQEIEVAREWIEQGFSLLKKRKNSQAAALAERLPHQLDLIRALMRVASYRAQAETLEKEIEALEGRLDLVKKRHHRLELRYRGKDLSFAYPKRKDAR